MLISINPQHVENIFNGTKKYEYRKIRCKQDVDKIIIYSTYPLENHKISALYLSGCAKYLVSSTSPISAVEAARPQVG